MLVEEGNKEFATYVVHVRHPPPGHNITLMDWHLSFLPDPSHLLHSFKRALSGFIANLSAVELEYLIHQEGFLHANPLRKNQLHTTHSPKFLGLYGDGFVSKLWSNTSQYGAGIIVGVIDGGINPTHPSFGDWGMSPPPPKWNGSCNFNDTSLCNNKLIGAKSFHSVSLFDPDSHESHTASTAAGQFVPNASVLGNARGIATGMAPYSHLAIYSVCSITDCIGTSWGIDEAINDGVNVLSISIGPKNSSYNPENLYEEDNFNAAFSANKEGVLVVMSAGNDGPEDVTVGNSPPWVLTVGASTTDRRIPAVVKLGNGIELEGESPYQPPDFIYFHPLIYLSSCNNASLLLLIPVRGMIVLCGTSPNVTKVKEAGVVGLIQLSEPGFGYGITMNGYDTSPSTDLLPTSLVTYADWQSIYKYIINTTDPTATIEFKGTEIRGVSDPAVASFSSRGPSTINGRILKPDIIGPGVDILAASHEGPNFVFMAGTSMACPHIAGIAALLMKAHPDWTPAMIKSAMMTTADPTNKDGKPILDQYNMTKASYYAKGAGHINPLKANDPGLVYDIHPEDYIPYLCGLNYDDNHISVITKMDGVSCADYTPINSANLNYPSITVPFTNNGASFFQVGRTLTNVGEPNSSYIAHVECPFGVTIELSSRELYFEAIGDKQSFDITFGFNYTEIEDISPTWPLEGSLIWVSRDSSIQVRSPILIEVS